MKNEKVVMVDGNSSGLNALNGELGGMNGWTVKQITAVPVPVSHDNNCSFKIIAVLQKA